MSHYPATEYKSIWSIKCLVSLPNKQVVRQECNIQVIPSTNNLLKKLFINVLNRKL